MASDEHEDDNEQEIHVLRVHYLVRPPEQMLGESIDRNRASSIRNQSNEKSFVLVGSSTVVPVFGLLIDKEFHSFPHV